RALFRLHVDVDLEVRIGRVGKLADGSAAVGTVTVRVGAHRVSVPLKASAKGVVKVKLGKKYGSSIRVRASFASNDAGNVSGKTSKTVTVRAKR
ncbi:MAG: hypothetical protein J0H64_03785, partial [Actinobacteria bacterium]|nr:hypothetical protein [Actinomycetota bacterium]